MSKKCYDPSFEWEPCKCGCGNHSFPATDIPSVMEANIMPCKQRGFEIVRDDELEKHGIDKNNIIIPERKTAKSAGYDLSSAITYTLAPGERKMIPTGLKAYMKDNEVLFIFLRSSSGIKKKLRLQNQVGVVDADYYGNEDNDGHIFVAIQNTNDEPYTINKGDRIAQGIFINYLVVDNDNATGERIGGHGSTGM